MSVRKVRNSWWVDLRVESTRYRKRSPENSAAGAKAYEALLRQRLARGEPIEREPGTTVACPRFDEFAVKWLEIYSKPNHKPSTYAGNVVRIRDIPSWLTARRLDEIGAVDIERLKAEKVAAGLAPATVNRFLGTLQKILQTAVDWGVLAAVPKAKKLREPPPPFTFLSPNECERLLGDRRDARCHEMVLLALRTGLRIGEMLGLDWSDLDFDRRIITVRRSVWNGQLGSPKSGKARHVPMTSDLTDTLVRRRQPMGLLFPSRRDFPGCDATARKALLRLCTHTGVRRIGWHALRHTFCSTLVMKGVPLTVVQALLGHADLRMTLRYSHLAPSATRDAVQLLVPQATARDGQPVGNAAREQAATTTLAVGEIGATMPNLGCHPVPVAA